jgi:hypothetical protein
MRRLVWVLHESKIHDGLLRNVAVRVLQKLVMGVQGWFLVFGCMN